MTTRLTAVRHFIAVALVTAVAPRVLLAQAPDSALRIPAVWGTSYVMVLKANPEYRPASQDAMAEVIRAHQRYSIELIERGRTVRGGPLVQVPGAALVGMTVLRASSPEGHSTRWWLASQSGTRSGRGTRFPQRG